MKNILIAFDVDGTLRDNKVDQRLAPVANERIRTLLIALAHMKNTRILVWSGGGELYCRQIVAAFGLQKYVDVIADKQVISCEKAKCDFWLLQGITNTDHWHFGTELRPDIAIDDMQAFTLGGINLIVREK